MIPLRQSDKPCLAAFLSDQDEATKAKYAAELGNADASEWREALDAAQIYLRAAEAVDKRNYYSCIAVSCAARDAGFEYYGRARQRYVTVFNPGEVLNEKNGIREIRVLMLCFMAAMAETGDA